MNTEKILLSMTANTCQCEHCKEIIRQQNRMQAWQKLKTNFNTLQNYQFSLHKEQ